MRSGISLGHFFKEATQQSNSMQIITHKVKKACQLINWTTHHLNSGLQGLKYSVSVGQHLNMSVCFDGNGASKVEEKIFKDDCDG